MISRLRDIIDGDGSRVGAAAAVVGAGAALVAALTHNPLLLTVTTMIGAGGLFRWATAIVRRFWTGGGRPRGHEWAVVVAGALELIILGLAMGHPGFRHGLIHGALGWPDNAAKIVQVIEVGRSVPTEQAGLVGPATTAQPPSPTPAVPPESPSPSPDASPSAPPRPSASRVVAARPAPADGELPGGGVSFRTVRVVVHNPAAEWKVGTSVTVRMGLPAGPALCTDVSVNNVVTVEGDIDFSQPDGQRLPFKGSTSEDPTPGADGTPTADPARSPNRLLATGYFDPGCTDPAGRSGRRAELSISFGVTLPLKPKALTTLEINIGDSIFADLPYRSLQDASSTVLIKLADGAELTQNSTAP